MTESERRRPRKRPAILRMHKAPERFTWKQLGGFVSARPRLTPRANG